MTSTESHLSSWGLAEGKGEPELQTGEKAPCTSSSTEVRGPGYPGRGPNILLCAITFTGTVRLCHGDKRSVISSPYRWGSHPQDVGGTGW